MTASVALAATTTVNVNPGNMDGWAFSTSGTPSTSSAKMVNGPENPPLGKGSAKLDVGSDGSDAAQLRNREYAGTELADLTTLIYSTYVQEDGSGGQAPYIILQLDNDGNGTVDDLLFFEPVYQTAAFFPSNPQPAIQLEEWQEWDALNGGWWSVNGIAGATPGTGVKSIEDYLDAEPDATIVNSANGAGGVRLVAGFGAGAWDGFIGYVDAFKIGVGSQNTVYNFEAGPSSKDDCKGNGWKAFEDPEFKNQGQCIKAAKH